MQPITKNDIISLCQDLIKHPYGTICVHYVAGTLLSLLEEKGIEVDENFKDACRYTCGCQDDLALQCLEELKD